MNATQAILELLIRAVSNATEQLNNIHDLPASERVRWEGRRKMLVEIEEQARAWAYEDVT